MRSLINKYHDTKKDIIPYTVQFEIHQYLSKYKVGDIYLYEHIPFSKCQSLIMDCWRNRKKVRALNIARETGLSRAVGRPRECPEKKKLRQEAAMLEAPLVAPRRPWSRQYLCFSFISLASLIIDSFISVTPVLRLKRLVRSSIDCIISPSNRPNQGYLNSCNFDNWKITQY